MSFETKEKRRGGVAKKIYESQQARLSRRAHSSEFQALLASCHAVDSSGEICCNGELLRFRHPAPLFLPLLLRNILTGNSGGLDGHRGDDGRRGGGRGGGDGLKLFD